MNNIINLDSRGLQKNYLERIQVDAVKENYYKVVSPFDTMRWGFTNDKKEFIDPLGGPMIIAGEPLPHHDNIFVKNILFLKEIGVVLELTTNDNGNL